MLLRLLTPVYLLAALFSSLTVSQTLHTDDRWILNARNQRVKLNCVNWAGHGETNIPEGLHAQSIGYITSWIANNGFNCVRLTYSIDMALDPYQLVSSSFKDAAAESGLGKNVTDLYWQAVKKNPLLLIATTRSTFAAVITSLGLKGIMVILDNHNSAAGWCCSQNDGNGWWDEASGYVEANSRNFNTANWVAGLEAMAKFGKFFPNVVGYALRNELRAVTGQNNSDWYEFVERGAAAVHRGDPQGLVVIGGVNYALEFEFLKEKNFDRKKLGIEKKTVWEFHSYTWSGSYTNDCAAYKQKLDVDPKFLIESGKAWTGPLWLSEFGWAQNGPSKNEQVYAECLSEWLGENQVGWAYWALQGTYYIREGQANYDEGFGLMSQDWKGWRNESFPAVWSAAWQ